MAKRSALRNSVAHTPAARTESSDPNVDHPVKDSAAALHVVPRSESRVTRKGPALGEILVERKTLTEEQLREAMTRQQRTRKRLGEILMELGFASPDAVLDGLSAQLGVPPTRVNSYTVTPEALTYLSEKVARKYTAVPLLKVGSTLIVATANPRDLQALDDLRFAAGCEVQTMIALESEILQALATFYGNPFANDVEASARPSSWTCRVRSSICRTKARRSPPPRSSIAFWREAPATAPATFTSSRPSTASASASASTACCTKSRSCSRCSRRRWWRD